MGHVYHELGLSVACINHEASYLYDPKHISDEHIETENFKV